MAQADAAGAGDRRRCRQCRRKGGARGDERQGRNADDDGDPLPHGDSVPLLGLVVLDRDHYRNVRWDPEVRFGMKRVRKEAGTQPASRVRLRGMATSVVTGGAGFLGSHLCDYLLEQGHRVICVDSLETGSLLNIDHIRGADFPFVMADIPEHYESDEPIDFVYHMASPASPI